MQHLVTTVVALSIAQCLHPQAIWQHTAFIQLVVLHPARPAVDILLHVL
jgi:hypothetical protein